jgi:hypothetical protein
MREGFETRQLNEGKRFRDDRRRGGLENAEKGSASWMDVDARTITIAYMYNIEGGIEGERQYSKILEDRIVAEFVELISATRFTSCSPLYILLCDGFPPSGKYRIHYHPRDQMWRARTMSI